MCQFMQHREDIPVQAVASASEPDHRRSVVEAHGCAIKLGGLEREEVHQDHAAVCEPCLEIGEVSWIVDAVDQPDGELPSGVKVEGSNLSVLSDLANSGQPCGLLRGER